MKGEMKLNDLLHLIEFRKEVGKKDLVLESCEKWESRLADYNIILSERKKAELIDYIYQREVQPDHLIEVLHKRPEIVLRKLFGIENNKSFTTYFVEQYRIEDLIGQQQDTLEEDTIKYEEIALDEVIEPILQTDERKELVREEASEGERLPIDYMDVEPVKIQVCGDYNGKLSDLMDRLSSEIEQVVIPFEITDIFEQILTLKRYDVRIFNGKKYALSKKIRDDIILKMKEEAIECLKTGIPYQLSLWTNFYYHNIEYKTLLLTVSEWTMICNMFRNYDAGVFLLNGDLKLKIG